MWQAPNPEKGPIMGFRFRRSINFGPIRVNVGKGGVGSSVGVPGVRIGRKSDGRGYSTLSAPGTGLSYTTESSARQGSSSPGIAIVVLVVLALAVVLALLK